MKIYLATVKLPLLVAPSIGRGPVAEVLPGEEVTATQIPIRKGHTEGAYLVTADVAGVVHWGYAGRSALENFSIIATVNEGEVSN